MYNKNKVTLLKKIPSPQKHTQKNMTSILTYRRLSTPFLKYGISKKWCLPYPLNCFTVGGSPYAYITLANEDRETGNKVWPLYFNSTAYNYFNGFLGCFMNVWDCPVFNTLCLGYSNFTNKILANNLLKF